MGISLYFWIACAPKQTDSLQVLRRGNASVWCIWHWISVSHRGGGSISRWHNKAYRNNGRVEFRLNSSAQGSDQHGQRWVFSAQVAHSEITAGDASRVTVQKDWSCMGEERTRRKVQSYAFQINGIVESSHVLAVTCINGLSVGTACQGAEGGAHRSCQS